MSDRALMIEKLTKPFPQEAIKSRTIGGNRKADYVDGATVIRRLNEATDCQWDFTVDQYWTEPGTNGSGVTFAKVTLTIPGLGSRQHMGVQSYNERSGEDVVAKGAITDALKKAATLFGVALELYGPDHESGEPMPAQSPAQQPRRQSQRQQPPADEPDPDEYEAWAAQRKSAKPVQASSLPHSQQFIDRARAKHIKNEAEKSAFPLITALQKRGLDRLGQLTNDQADALLQEIADHTAAEDAELDAIGAQVE